MEANCKWLYRINIELQYSFRVDRTQTFLRQIFDELEWELSKNKILSANVNSSESFYLQSFINCNCYIVNAIKTLNVRSKLEDGAQVLGELIDFFKAPKGLSVSRSVFLHVCKYHGASLQVL